jgi:integrase
MGKKRTKNKDLPQRVYPKHGAYYYVTPLNKWIHLGRTKAEMYQGLAALEIKPSGGYTARNLWNDFSEDQLPKLSPATQEGYRKSVVNVLKVFGDVQLDKIASKDIAQYLRIRGKKAAGSSNKEIGLFSSMFTYAVALGNAERNPCLRVKRNTESPRTRYVEDWELGEFLRVCPPMLVAYLELKYLIGIRKTDMLKLSLAHIKERGLYVRPNKTKNSTGETREFIWTDDLRAAIAKAKSLPRPEYQTLLFCNARGRSFLTEKLKTPAFDRIWRSTMDRALKETELSERFQERDIRAKTATDADDDGQDATKILGHASSGVTRRYIRSKQIKAVMPLQKKKPDTDGEDKAKAS